MGKTIFISQAQLQTLPKETTSWQGVLAIAEPRAVCYPVINDGQVRKIGGDIEVKLA